MCLFPQVFILILHLEFLKKCRAAYPFQALESILVAKIKIVSQPLQVTTNSLGPNPFSLNEICKLLGSFNQKLKHGGVILFSGYSQNLYDIQLETGYSGGRIISRMDMTMMISWSV